MLCWSRVGVQHFCFGSPTWPPLRYLHTLSRDVLFPILFFSKIAKKQIIQMKKKNRNHFATMPPDFSWICSTHCTPSACCMSSLWLYLCFICGPMFLTTLQKLHKFCLSASKIVKNIRMEEISWSKLSQPFKENRTRRHLVYSSVALQLLNEFLFNTPNFGRNENTFPNTVAL